ncbi:hypothetical protein K438DRAFT_1992278 [Mycena galopus ATCC 62051]|nr:hypothetical protein K438DRAFT_1992278 [Mycena galopus ATCC 62051]
MSSAVIRAYPRASQRVPKYRQMLTYPLAQEAPKIRTVAIVTAVPVESHRPAVHPLKLRSVSQSAPCALRDPALARVVPAHCYPRLTTRKNPIPGTALPVVVMCRCPSRLPARTAHPAALLRRTDARTVAAHCYLRLTAGVPPMHGPPRYLVVRATAVLLCAREPVPPTLLGLCSELDPASAAR